MKDYYEKFIFIRRCELSQEVFSYTDKEANELYKNNKVEKNDYICKTTERIFEKEDLEYEEIFKSYYYLDKDLSKIENLKIKVIMKNRRDNYEKNKTKGKYYYSNCVYNNLKINLKNQERCQIKENKESLFEQIYLIDRFLIALNNGYFFVFTNIQNPSLTLNQLLENVKSNKEVSLENIKEILKSEELNTKNLQKYNDIAYYLQQANANNEAIFLLEKIIEKFPNRTVAYLNLGDAYNGLNNKEKAKSNYEKYIELMKKSGKEAKIPKRVLEFK